MRYFQPEDDLDWGDLVKVEMMGDRRTIKLDHFVRVDLTFVSQNRHIWLHFSPHNPVKSAWSMLALKKRCTKTGVARNDLSPKVCYLGGRQRARSMRLRFEDEAALVRGWIDCLTDEDSILHRRAWTDTFDVVDRIFYSVFQPSVQNSVRVMG